MIDATVCSRDAGDGAAERHEWRVGRIAPLCKKCGQGARRHGSRREPSKRESVATSLACSPESAESPAIASAIQSTRVTKPT